MTQLLPVAEVLSVVKDAAALLGRRPVRSLGLGLALAVALISVGCGIGLVAFPFWSVESLRTLLAEGGGPGPTPGDRIRARVKATTFVALSVLPLTLLLLVVWVAATVETGVLSGLPPAPAELGELVRRGWPYGIGAVGLAVVLLSPFSLAPLLLLEARQGDGLAAAAASAAMALRSGAARWWGAAAVALLGTFGPALLFGAALQQVLPGSATVLALSLSGLAVALAFGHGILVVVYRRTVAAVSATQTPVAPAVSRRSVVLSALALAPLLWLLPMCASLFRPSSLAPGPAAGEMVALVALHDRPKRIRVPSTDLTVEAAADAVVVSVSDGGGAGRMPLASEADVTRVRITATAHGFGLELQQGHNRAHTWLDRAGVRLDDGLGARLSRRFAVPLLLALAALAVFSAWLSPLGAARTALAAAAMAAEPPQARGARPWGGLAAVLWVAHAAAAAACWGAFLGP